VKVTNTLFAISIVALLFASNIALGFSHLEAGGEAFSVAEYESFHDVLHPLEHEALPNRDFTRIRSQAPELIRLGRAIVKLGVPKGTAQQHNGSNFIRGYDPDTGKELWRLGGSSKITAPTPVFRDDLIVVASGRRPEAPIFVIRGGALGNITLDKEQTSNQFVVWSKQARGSYMPTPLIYGNYLYVLSNQGVLDCYDLHSGNEIYRQRMSHQRGGFSGSPIAADGKIYLPSEDGDVFVVKAGPEFETWVRIR